MTHVKDTRAPRAMPLAAAALGAVLLAGCASPPGGNARDDQAARLRLARMAEANGNINDELALLAPAAHLDQIVTAVNTAYNPTGTGKNFFDASGTTAGTIALDPEPERRDPDGGDGRRGRQHDGPGGCSACKHVVFHGLRRRDQRHVYVLLLKLGQHLRPERRERDLEPRRPAERPDAPREPALEHQRSQHGRGDVNLVQFQQAYVASSETFNIINQILGNEISQLGAQG